MSHVLKYELAQEILSPFRQLSENQPTSSMKIYLVNFEQGQLMNNGTTVLLSKKLDRSSFLVTFLSYVEKSASLSRGGLKFSVTYLHIWSLMDVLNNKLAMVFPMISERCQIMVRASNVLIFRGVLSLKAWGIPGTKITRILSNVLHYRPKPMPYVLLIMWASAGNVIITKPKTMTCA